MLQVYDRVSPAAISPLVGLSLIVLLPTCAGLLDALRARMLPASPPSSTPVCNITYTTPLAPAIYAAQRHAGAAADCATLTACLFLSGMGPTAFLDCRGCALFLVTLFVFPRSSE